jgi:hypothetical protein
MVRGLDGLGLVGMDDGLVCCMGCIENLKLWDGGVGVLDPRKSDRSGYHAPS